MIEDEICPICNGTGQDPDLIEDNEEDFPCESCAGSGWSKNEVTAP